MACKRSAVRSRLAPPITSLLHDTFLLKYKLHKFRVDLSIEIATMKTCFHWYTILSMTDSRDYLRIQKAIEFIILARPSQPSLDEIAQAVHLSPHHFQRLFQKWAGVSPKKFIQFISVEHAKSLLENHKSLQETSHAVGLSGTGRLHDLFVSIEGMTPGQYKSSGAGLRIYYDFYETLFGSLIIATTDIGICHMAFHDDWDKAEQELTTFFANAECFKQPHPNHQQGLSFFQSLDQPPSMIKLHVAASPFQLKVWQCLLSIETGQLLNYAQIAERIGQPKAARAVGTAIANNPIAYIIPCHRVIRNTGELGNYRWGSLRKTAMVGWESSQVRSND